jgi:hypothetical protein
VCGDHVQNSAWHLAHLLLRGFVVVCQELHRYAAICSNSRKVIV